MCISVSIQWAFLTSLVTSMRIDVQKQKKTQEFVECVEHDKMEKRKQRGYDRDSWHRYSYLRKRELGTGSRL